MVTDNDSLKQNYMENESKNKAENTDSSNEKLLLSDVSVAKRKVCTYDSELFQRETCANVRFDCNKCEFFKVQT